MSRRTDKKGRSKGSLGSFVAIERYLLNSKAWLDLKPMARACYLELANAYSGSNNGKIAMSARIMGDRLGMDKATGARGIAELEAKGFIHCVKNSTFSQKGKLCREYRLTAFKCDATGDLATKTFMQWKPEIQNTVAQVRLNGCTGATTPHQKPLKQASQLHRCDREAHIEGDDSRTGAPHLYSNHRPHTPLSPAQAGAANQRASVPTSLHSLDPDTFQTIGGLALQSLVQFDKSMPAHLKSWRPTDNPSPQTILASKTA